MYTYRIHRDSTIGIYEVESYKPYKDEQFEVVVIYNTEESGKRLFNETSTYIVDNIYESLIECINAVKDFVYCKMKDGNSIVVYPERVRLKKEALEKKIENSSKFIINKDFKFPFGKYKGLTCERMIEIDGAAAYKYVGWFCKTVGATMDESYYNCFKEKCFKPRSGEYTGLNHYDVYAMDLIGPEPY